MASKPWAGVAEDVNWLLRANASAAPGVAAGWPRRVEEKGRSELALLACRYSLLYRPVSLLDRANEQFGCQADNIAFS